ncbi:MAG: hypothetical protein COB67_11490, partial [SAR324 cluster bacterium]
EYTKFCVIRNPYERMLSWYSRFRNGVINDEAVVKANTETSPTNQLFWKVYTKGYKLLNQANTPKKAILFKYWAQLFRLFGQFRPDGEIDFGLRSESVGANLMLAVNNNAENFSEFLQLSKDHHEGIFSKFYDNQLDYISDGNTIIADKILRFEYLARDFAVLAQEIGFAGTLPHTNKSKSRESYRNYYNDASRELVGMRFEKDLDYFQYNF